MKRTWSVGAALAAGLCALAAAGVDALSLDEADTEISLDEKGAGGSEWEDESPVETAKADNWTKLGGKGAGRVTGETVTLKAGEAVEASVPASENSKGFAFGFRAHGTGKLKVTFKARTVYGNDTPLVGKGGHKAPLEFPLIDCDRPYRIHAGKPPLGTKKCVLKIVAEGEVVLSGMELESVKTPPPKITEINRSQKTLPPGYVMGRELPLAAGRADLAPGTYPFAATDGLGEKRAKSALDGVPVERYAFEAKPGRSTAALAEGFGTKLRAALDARGGASLSLAREPDHDVQAYRLDAKDGSVLVAVVNWSERDTKADLKVRLPFAAGRLEVVSEDGLYDAPFADDVRIELPKEAVRMLRFSK